tara:strand:- start:205 stop:438 length:234 start_codon:yes stop_codon:yes gene_type:complete
MSLLYIKESYVYNLPGREMHCHTDNCGYWRSKDDHSYGLFSPLRMFKVNGAYACQGCLNDTIKEIYEALDDVGEEEQ